MGIIAEMVNTFCDYLGKVIHDIKGGQKEQQWLLNYIQFK
jgi:hypothetical protein